MSQQTGKIEIEIPNRDRSVPICHHCGKSVMERAKRYLKTVGDEEIDLFEILQDENGDYYHNACYEECRRKQRRMKEWLELLKKEYPNVGDGTLERLRDDEDALAEFANSTYCILTSSGNLLFADNLEDLAYELLEVGISDSSEDKDEVKEIHVDQSLHKGDCYISHIVVLRDWSDNEGRN